MVGARGLEWSLVSNREEIFNENWPLLIWDDGTLWPFDQETSCRYPILLDTVSYSCRNISLMRKEKEYRSVFLFNREEILTEQIDHAVVQDRIEPNEIFDEQEEATVDHRIHQFIRCDLDETREPHWSIPALSPSTSHSRRNGGQRPVVSGGQQDTSAAKSEEKCPRSVRPWSDRTFSVDIVRRSPSSFLENTMVSPHRDEAELTLAWFYRNHNPAVCKHRAFRSGKWYIDECNWSCHLHPACPSGRPTLPIADDDCAKPCTLRNAKHDSGRLPRRRSSSSNYLIAVVH